MPVENNVAKVIRIKQMTVSKTVTEVVKNNFVYWKKYSINSYFL